MTRIIRAKTKTRSINIWLSKLYKNTIETEVKEILLLLSEF